MAPLPGASRAATGRAAAAADGSPAKLVPEALIMNKEDGASSSSSRRRRDTLDRRRGSLCNPRVGARPAAGQHPGSSTMGRPSRPRSAVLASCRVKPWESP